VNQSALLKMSGIEKRFGATLALAGVDLSVRAGEVHALVGENGAGKSTLMKILSGAVRPDKGKMELYGQPYLPANPLQARLTGVAMIYQELSLAPHLTVEQNINLGMEPRRGVVVEKRKAARLAEEALARLGHPEIPPSRRVSGLPVAAQQVVEIARALAVGCRVLVLDEPTSSLPKEDVATLFELVRRLKEQGRAIVYISHFIEEVKEIADRLTVLRDGAVCGQGYCCDFTVDEIVRMMVGREIRDMYPRSERTPEGPVLIIEDLAGMEKPESASLELFRGEVLGIAGLVGAGRTELVRSLFGLDPVRKGRIKVGAYVGPASPARRWAQGAGMVSEDRKGEGLAVSMSVADNITMTKLKNMGPLGLVTPSGQNRAAAGLIKALDIRTQGPGQRVADLSGGNQQKTALARLLHHDVDVLLLDEPTKGIDVGSKAQVYGLIDELVSGAPGGKKAVLLVSSYLPELLGVCDRIAVMCRGRLGPARDASELDEHSLMREATGGEAA